MLREREGVTRPSHCRHHRTGLPDPRPSLADQGAGVSPLHVLARLGTGSEVAELVCFPASGASSEMIGGYYLTNGGDTAR